MCLFQFLFSLFLSLHVFTNKDSKPTTHTNCHAVKYQTDVLTNIAYHTNNVAQQLTAYLEAQATETEALALQMKTISLRLAAMKEATGAQGLRRTEALKSYQRSEKLSKLSEDQLPPHAQPLSGWKRPGQVDYSSLESINQAMNGR